MEANRKDPMTYPENIRAAFREVALGLMEWQDPPPVERRTPKVYRPYDPQGEVEPFDIDRDWEENN